MRLLRLSVLLALATLTGSAPGQSPDTAFTFELTPDRLAVAPGQAAVLVLRVSSSPGHYLYRDMFELRPVDRAGVRFGDPVYARPVRKFDPILQEEKDVYDGSHLFEVPFQLAADAPAEGTLELRVDYQGCAPDICFLPDSRTLTAAWGPPAATGPGPVDPVGELSGSVEPAGAAPDPAPPAAPDPAPPAEPDSLFRNLAEANYLLAFLALFAAGVLTSFTPCVYPVIPITISLFGARGADSRLKAFLLSVVYVQGIAVTYSALGIGAAMTGAVFGQYMSSLWVVGGVAGLFVLLGLSMAGVFELALPGSLQTRVSGVGGRGWLGAFSMGLVAGVIAAPCTGPVLASVLAWVTTTRDALLGFLLLYTYAMGLGLLFIVLGTFSSLVSRLPRSGGWMDGVKALFAVAMFTMALYFLKDHVAWLRVEGMGGSALLLTGQAILLAGLLTRWLGLNLHGAGWAVWLRKFAALALATQGAFLMLLGVTRPDTPSHPGGPAAVAQFWRTDLDVALADAQRLGQPVIVDFSADWCAACKELDRYTFSDARVQAALARFVRVRVDLTRSDGETPRLKQAYGIVGLPLVVFHAPDGALLNRPRITGFLGPDPFLAELAGVPMSDPSPDRR